MKSQMIQPTIEFDAEAHEYRVNGEVYPSVTQIIHEFGLMDTSHFTDEAAARGRYVAEATAMDDRGELDFDACAAGAKGYIEAWRRFRRETGFIPLQIEQVVVSPIYKYAGTLDRLGLLQSAKWLLDIKCGAFARWHFLQLALYALATPGLGSATKRAVVALGDDGTYSIKPDENPVIHMAAAQALAQISRWKRNARCQSTQAS